MLLLQSGLPKSGNLWLHKIIQETLRLSGTELRSFIQSQPIYQEARTWPGFAEQAGIDFIEFDSGSCFFRKGAFRQPIADVDEYLRQCTHVWTHALWVPRCNQVFGKFEKFVYIVRDPRDVAVSAAKYFFTPFMLAQHPQQEPDAETYLHHRLYEQIITWVQHVGGYLLHADQFRIHFVFYERLLHDFDSEFRLLLSYLGINLPAAAALQVKESVRFDNMKRQNPHHLRKGEAGGWVNVLTTAQRRQVAKMAGSMMTILGYHPVDEPAQATLPGLPAHIDHDQVHDAITAARGGLGDRLRYARVFFTSRRPLREKLTKGLEYLGGKGRWNADP